MTATALVSESSPPSVAPDPPTGTRGRESEGSLDFRALLSSLCPDPTAPATEWPCADPAWSGWFKNDYHAWPDWVQGFRPHQLEAVVEIIDAYARGAQVVFVDAPTGAGKTLIGEMVRRLITNRALYVCHGLGLQDQFVRDFPDAAVLKGKTNYPTHLAPFPDTTAADCNRHKPTKKEVSDGAEPGEALCSWCPDVKRCPQAVALDTALTAELAVVNTSLLFARMSQVAPGRGLVVIDEADTLETLMMGELEFRVSAGTLRRIGVQAPKKGSHSPTLAKWIKNDLATAVSRGVRDLSSVLVGDPEDVTARRQQRQLMGLLKRCPDMAREVESDEWVRDYDKTDGFILKPVRASDFSQEMLWKWAPLWLLMSATLVSTDEMMDSLGMDGMRVETVTVPMTFPIENRTIHAVPIAAMTAANKDEAWPAMARAIKGIQELHPEDKILVHTVSYDLAKYLSLNARGDGRAVYNYNDSTSRDQAVQQFKDDRRGLDVFDVEGRRPAIMFAPSLDRGFDFKGDEARVVVVAKVPYPYLGDQQVSARLHTRGGQQWYTVQTVRSLIQMTGRGVRSADDWCTSYILDSTFLTKLWKKDKRLLPKWWREAVDTGTTRRDLGL